MKKLPYKVATCPAQAVTTCIAGLDIVYS